MAEPKALLRTNDDVTRCWWCGDDPGYVDYHDREWGYPVDDGRRLFEKICLEGFQAGLSWLTILRKRENFRRAFREFDIDTVARFNQRTVARLVQDAGIIRHRKKIESTINNAKRAREMIERQGSLAGFFWQFEPQSKKAGDACAATSPESEALSKELKRLGWTFVGPTTCYAFMQSMGLVNDHVPGCEMREPVEQAREAFRRPH